MKKRTILFLLVVLNLFLFASPGYCLLAGTHGNAAKIIPRVLMGADIEIHNIGKTVRDMDVIIAPYDLDLHEISIQGSFAKDGGSLNLVEYEADLQYWRDSAVLGITFDVDLIIMRGGELQNAVVIIGNPAYDRNSWPNDAGNIYKIVLDADAGRISVLHEKNGVADRNWSMNYAVKINTTYRISVINSKDTTVGQLPPQGTIIIDEMGIPKLGGLPKSTEILHSDLGAMGFDPKDFSAPCNFGFYVGSYLSKARFWNERIVVYNKF